MAVNNSLMQNPTIQNTAEDKLTIKYKSGDEEVTLTPAFVKKYLVSGNPEKITAQEIVLFMNLCKYQHLNPYLREAYCIKYGEKPATIVTGKIALEKRANRCADYEGFEAGVIVLNRNGDIENRTGTLVISGETLVGGWCDVYVGRFKKPVKVTVSLNEYIGRKNDGSVNSQWASKPATMIRKVAKMQALREAFPEDFAGMYSAEELSAGNADEDVVDIPANNENYEEKPQESDDFAELLG